MKLLLDKTTRKALRSIMGQLETLQAAQTVVKSQTLADGIEFLDAVLTGVKLYRATKRQQRQDRAKQQWLKINHLPFQGDDE